MNEFDRHPVCHLHGDTVDSISTAGNTIQSIAVDIQWIKRVGYGVLVVAVSFSFSVWGIFYPHLVSLNEQIVTIKQELKVESVRIAQIEQTQQESKQDRKELRQCLNQLKLDNTR